MFPFIYIFKISFFWFISNLKNFNNFFLSLEFIEQLKLRTGNFSNKSISLLQTKVLSIILSFFQFLTYHKLNCF